MMPIVAALADLRRSAGILQREIAATLGLGAKAGVTMVSSWEHGSAIPKVGHVAGYAQAVGHRVVVQKDGETVGDLVDVYPRLAELRRAAGFSRAVLAAQLFINRASVLSAERLAGPGAQLPTAVRYLGALGYRVVLVPHELREAS